MSVTGRTNRRSLLAIGLISLTPVIAACGTPSAASTVMPAGTPSASAADPASSSSQSAASSAAGTVPLVVYSAQGYDSAVTTAFQKATGIPVKLVDDSTGPLLTKVAAEKNNPTWNVLWVDGDTAFAALDQQGLLASYSPTAKFTAAGAELQPKDHSYVAVSTTAMPGVIYNAARTSTVPASYQDLLGSAYQGKVGMNDPAQSGPTYPFVAGMMNQLGGQANGEAAGKAYFSKLRANGLKVFPTNGDTLHALETGQIDYGLIQSSAIAGELLKVKPTAQFQPKAVYLPKATLLPGVIGIDKANSPQAMKEAQQFVDYVLSPAGQKVMLTGDLKGDSNYWPIVSGVQPNANLGALPASQRIDPYFWGPKEGEINTWFDQAIKQ
ncbi:MAG TPA: extracellular solute-binding protein [Propionibacteriaceae bacterium]|nr:extracellular solute-binding protein [Propionibacteriaceae bacterium]